MENKGIKHFFVVTFFLLSLLMLVVPMRSSAINKQGFLPKDNCSLGFMGELVCEDIQNLSFSFSGKVEMKDNAAAQIMLGDEVVAETNKIVLKKQWNYYEPITLVKVTFDPILQLPKGHVYRFVIPAGSFYDHDSLSVLSGECSWKFEVPKSFVGYDSQLYDGCTLPWLQHGGFDFGKTRMELVGNPQFFLYKNGNLVAKTNANFECCTYECVHGYITFMFDERIVLDDGARYTLVFPEGSVHSTVCKELVNDEIRINITGGPREAPDLGEENTSEIAPLYFAFRDELSMPSYVFYSDLEKPYFYFNHLVDVQKGAKAYVMCGGETMAVSDTIVTDTYRTTTWVRAVFNAPVRLPKDNVYRLVIPAGALRSHDDPTVTLGRIENRFVVPGDFEASISRYSKIYEGRSLETIKSGVIGFSEATLCKSIITPKLYLYKDDEVVAVADCTFDGDIDYTILRFDFGEAVHLEDNAHYQLVFPAGTVYAGIRRDIQNRELRINIYGPKVDNGVEDISSDEGVSVSFRGDVLCINNVPRGEIIEVLSFDGRLVQRCKAKQNNIDLPLPGKGCYVVRVGGKTVKGILN